MILVDDRTGSRHIAKLLPSKICDLDRLDYGDFFWCGNGPGGGVVTVAVELKKLNDALKCITDGRFAGHQLPGLRSTYDVCYLLVEGLWRPGKDGVLEVPRGRGKWEAVEIGYRRFMYSDFVGWLTTMEQAGGMRLRFSASTWGTAQEVMALYRWWTSKRYDEHRAHLALDSSGVPVALSRTSLVRRVAKELPGIGWEKAGKVEGKFRSVAEMCRADEKEWRQVEGIGKVLAKRVVEGLGGKTGEKYRKQGGKKKWE